MYTAAYGASEKETESYTEDESQGKKKTSHKILEPLFFDGIAAQPTGVVQALC